MDVIDSVSNCKHVSGKIELLKIDEERDQLKSSSEREDLKLNQSIQDQGRSPSVSQEIKLKKELKKISKNQSDRQVIPDDFKIQNEEIENHVQT